MIDVEMPQMGESIVEGTLTKWLKKPGDKVERDEPLFEISTDKVDTEIPAPAAGTMGEILVTEGTTVGVNTIVGRIDETGGAAPAASAPPAAPPPVAAAAPPPPPPPAPPAPPLPSAPAPLPKVEGAKTRVEAMSTMRQKIAEHMIFSKQTSAHVTTVHKVDITKIAKLRDKLKAGFHER